MIGYPVYGSTSTSPNEPNEPEGDENEFAPLLLTLEKLSLPLLNVPQLIGWNIIALY
jgi:hypothetical protein